jgi:hypothetical protein
MRLRADLEWYWARDWAKALTRYIRRPNDFSAAYDFLYLHPANQRRVAVGDLGPLGPDGWFHMNMDWSIAKVDPKTHRIETVTTKKGYQRDDTKRNTATQVWLEWGPYSEQENIESHDPRTDTGAPTFEEALVNLAHNVFMLYGDRTTVADEAKLKKHDRR